MRGGFSFILLFLVPMVFAEWQSMLPDVGGWTDGVTISPHDGDRVLIGGDVFGSAVSEDGGRTWQPSYGFLMTEIESFTFHQTDPLIVFAATHGGVYRSTDGGHTFSPSRNGFPQMHDPADYGDRFYSAPVSYIAADPMNPGTFYAGLGTMRFQSSRNYFEDRMGDIYKTIDSGNTWDRIYTNTNSDYCESNIQHIIVDPFDSDILYKTLACDYIWRSDDGGSTWTRRSSGLNEDDGRIVVADPDEEGVLYLSTGKSGSIYKTSYRGESWEELTNQPRAEAIAYCDGRLYAGSMYHGNGLWRSLDSGTTWENMFHIEECPNNENPRCCNSELGRCTQYYSDNFPWTPMVIDYGLKVRHHALAVDLNDCDHIVYAGSSVAMYSYDAGVTSKNAFGDPVADPDFRWRWPASDFGGACIYTIEFDENRIFAGGSDSQIWISDDSGENWVFPYKGITPTDGWNRYIDASFTDDALHVIVTRSSAGLTAAINNGALHTSTDGGITFTSQVGGYTSVEAIGNTLCIAKAGRIYKSTDNGNTMEPVTQDIDAFYISSLGNNFYATTTGGEVFRSVDACTTWEDLGNPYARSLDGGSFYAQSRVAPDPTDPGVFFFATRAGFHKYDDGWSTLDFPHDVEYGRGMAVGLDGSVYASSSSGPHRDAYREEEGIWRTEDGENWVKITTPENIRINRFYTISIDPGTGDLWAGGNCGGAFRLQSGSGPPIQRCDEADQIPYGSISGPDLVSFMISYIFGSVDQSQLLDAITKWKNGC